MATPHPSDEPRDVAVPDDWVTPTVLGDFKWPGPNGADPQPEMTLGRARWRRALEPMINALQVSSGGLTMMNTFREFALVIRLGQALCLARTDLPGEQEVRREWTNLLPDTKEKPNPFDETQSHNDDRNAVCAWVGKETARLSWRTTRDKDILMKAVIAQLMMYWTTQAWVGQMAPTQSIAASVKKAREELYSQDGERVYRKWDELGQGMGAFLLAWQQTRKAMGQRQRAPTLEKMDRRAAELADSLMVLRVFAATCPNQVGEEEKKALRESGTFLEDCHPNPEVRKFVHSLEDREILVAVAERTMPLAGIVDGQATAETRKRKL